jgi:hypothetical protein
MRLIVIALFSLIIAVSSLSGVNAADFGISYAIPDGFTIQKRNPPLKGWPEIYMVQSSKIHPEAQRPLDLSIGDFDVELTAMVIGAGDHMKGTYKKQIGSHSVVVLPAGPGPCGESLFFYIVPRDGGTSIVIMAPRFLIKRGVSSKEWPPSDMDSIIEGLIATMRFESNAKSK